MNNRYLPIVLGATVGLIAAGSFYILASKYHDYREEKRERRRELVKNICEKLDDLGDNLCKDLDQVHKELEENDRRSRETW
jgi:hypothetical protein